MKQNLTPIVLSGAAILFLLPAGAVRAQVPNAVQVPQPIELPNPPRRPMQFPGSGFTLKHAAEWYFYQNPDYKTAKDRLTAARAAAKAEAIASAEAQLAEISRKGMREIKKAYLEAVLSRLLLYEAQENLGFFDNYINRWQARYEEGIAPESEAVKWKFERARVVDAMAELRLAERLARIRLFALLGKTNSTEQPELWVYLADAPAVPMRATPGDLVARAKRLPAEGEKLVLWAEIETAWASAETHRERALAIKAQQIAPSEYLRGVAASYYNEYEGALIALLEAQRRRWESRNDYWRALAAYHTSLADLEAAVGLPLPEIEP